MLNGGLARRLLDRRSGWRTLRMLLWPLLAALVKIDGAAVLYMARNHMQTGNALSANLIGFVPPDLDGSHGAA
jgi:hypothetical protein